MFALKLPLILGIFSFFLASGYNPPPDDDVQTTRASGTRGCPVPLGELYLLGHQLETHHSQPILLFWLEPAKQPETLLFVLKNRDFQPIFQKKVEIQRTGYFPLKVSSDLTAKEKYTITAGLLCQESTLHAKILETSLTKVAYPTALDQKVAQFLAKNPQTLELLHEVPHQSP